MKNKDVEMKFWLEEQLHTLLTCMDHAQFVTELTQTVHHLGFDYFAYGMRVSIPITQPQFKLLNNYPEAWQQRYERQGYMACDPTVKHGIKSNTPVTWSESLYKDVQHFWEDAKSYGLCWGWAQSSRLNRSAIGMLTLARSGEELRANELYEKTPHLLWINQLAQVKFQEAWLEGMLPHPESPLSKREIEVIKWCAEGKTSFEIAAILNISERTANFHIGNSIKKLNVNNKTAVVIRAFQLGII
ncbi:autoinducer binding domain-containing protein [Microbulbifer sp. ZKSA006]|uniref:autoinducer binding domain-containing protein n=1 Tax=Microbulbifer sp. ZKSA006 TaxID=3243390 RepID=UPI004039EB18